MATIEFELPEEMLRLLDVMVEESGTSRSDIALAAFTPFFFGEPAGYRYPLDGQVEQADFQVPEDEAHG